ncbi:MAG TPA: protein kinase [Ktedonobacteraceae bacterium]|nr:protein kinase [Ktedonobacteraceae bacterium]
MLHVDQLVGRMLGDYQIERILGQGQLSTVYLGQQKLQGQAVTITMFNFPAGISAQARERFNTRFAQECAVLVRLKHPNILPTYAYGEQDDHPYLVTSFVKVASLAQVLKQQARFTPKQALSVLKQVAAGLDYAHSNGIVHGVLSLANILVINEHSMQIAGFGLKTLLELHGNTQVKQLPSHLFSASGKFLGSPECISPERIAGIPTDGRSDVYALGVMLFELLSGTPPFSGSDILETVLKRIQQPPPSLHALCPDVPEALDLVISKALERDPAARYQHAGEITTAFERILKVLEAAERTPPTSAERMMQNTQMTLPPTVNWFDEDILTTTSTWQMNSPDAMPAKPVQTTREEGLSIPGVDPFALWSATSVMTEPFKPDGSRQRPPLSFVAGTTRSRRQPAQPDRRRLVKLIVVGTATAGAFAVGGISFANFMRSMNQSQSQVNNSPISSNAITSGTTPTNSPQKTSTAGKSSTATPTQKPKPSPTQKPTPKPTQPPHQGTVIGYTSLGTNSAKSFSNPADGHSSLLVHLPNGNFAAFERACTHEGVPVNYDSGSHQFVCPAHGAIFDPASGSHLSGPGYGPLRSVPIAVNSDGTITTG